MSIIGKIKFKGFCEDFFNNAGASKATYGKIEYCIEQNL